MSNLDHEIEMMSRQIVRVRTSAQIALGELQVRADTAEKTGAALLAARGHQLAMEVMAGAVEREVHRRELRRRARARKREVKGTEPGRPKKAASPPVDECIIRLPEVMRRTGKSKTAIYDEANAGEFPKAVSLGGRAVGWRESDIAAWISARR